MSTSEPRVKKEPAADAGPAVLLHNTRTRLAGCTRRIEKLDVRLNDSDAATGKTVLERVIDVLWTDALLRQFGSGFQQLYKTHVKEAQSPKERVVNTLQTAQKWLSAAHEWICALAEVVAVHQPDGSFLFVPIAELCASSDGDVTTEVLSDTRHDCAVCAHNPATRCLLTAARLDAQISDAVPNEDGCRFYFCDTHWDAMKAVLDVNNVAKTMDGSINASETSALISSVRNVVTSGAGTGVASGAVDTSSKTPARRRARIEHVQPPHVTTRPKRIKDTNVLSAMDDRAKLHVAQDLSELVQRRVSGCTWLAKFVALRANMMRRRTKRVNLDEETSL